MISSDFWTERVVLQEEQFKEITFELKSTCSLQKIQFKEIIPISIFIKIVHIDKISIP